MFKYCKLFIAHFLLCIATTYIFSIQVRIQDVEFKLVLVHSTKHQRLLTKTWKQLNKTLFTYKWRLPTLSHDYIISNLDIITDKATYKHIFFPLEGANLLQSQMSKPNVKCLQTANWGLLVSEVLSWVIQWVVSYSLVSRDARE